MLELVPIFDEVEEVFLLVSEVRTPLERGWTWGQLECLQLKKSERVCVQSQLEGDSAGEGGTAEDKRKGVFLVQIKVKIKNGRRKNTHRTL